MTSMKDTVHTPYNKNEDITLISQNHPDILASSITTKVPSLYRGHNNSTLSMSQDNPHQILNNDKQFSQSLLKNKALLIPTRLALKRQRASMKPLRLNQESAEQDTLQMELGHPDQATSLHSLENDARKVNFSAELIRTETVSNHTSTVQDETPHSLPTDISILYRQKPLFSHPVTGHYIVQYAEENGTPSPCSYILPRKSCREKNAPAYTFGSRCLVEKTGGSRTGWQKQWFANTNPFTIKVDFNRETAWPTPFHYPARPTIGIQPSKVSFPSWSMAGRLQTNPILAPGDNPSPDTYDTISAFNKLNAKNTHITLKSRPGGTQISTTKLTGKIPGPGAHDPKNFLSNKYSAPKYSFGRRMPTSLAQDPYVNTLPPIQI